jgi:hypothetical protein
VFFSDHASSKFVMCGSFCRLPPKRIESYVEVQVDGGCRLSLLIRETLGRFYHCWSFSGLLKRETGGWFPCFAVQMVVFTPTVNPTQTELRRVFGSR